MTDANNSPPMKRTRRMAREPEVEATIPDDTSGTAGALKRTARSILIVDLLAREEGATIDQLTAATGWLPHTTRAALTGLRKKGHAVISEKAGGGSRVYRIGAG